MVANFGLGPVAHGIGLFQPVIGYNGRITVSAISCREMMPDPAACCDGLTDSFEDLKQATTRKKTRRAKSNGSDRAPAGVPRKPARKRASRKHPATP